MKTILLLIFCLPVLVRAQSSLQGKVMDADSKSPIIFGTVALMQEGKIIRGVETDIDGEYLFVDVLPGMYDVEASYIGYMPTTKTKVELSSVQNTELDILIKEGVLDSYPIFTCVRYAVPLIDFDNMSSGATYISTDIRNMALPR